MKEFGKRLKHLRENKKIIDDKWTQEYVADLIGVARPTYTAYENGTKQPPLETVKKIADIFDVRVDYLLGRDTKDKGKEINLEGLSENRKKMIEEIWKMNEDDLNYFYDLYKRLKK